MSLKSKLLLGTLLILAILSICSLFYKAFITKDFEITNPESELTE
jgi:hypothetical protein